MASFQLILWLLQIFLSILAGTRNLCLLYLGTDSGKQGHFLTKGSHRTMTLFLQPWILKEMLSPVSGLDSRASDHSTSASRTSQTFGHHTNILEYFFICRYPFVMYCQDNRDILFHINDPLNNNRSKLFINTFLPKNLSTQYSYFAFMRICVYAFMPFHRLGIHQPALS